VTVQKTSITPSTHLSMRSGMLPGAGLALAIGVLFSMPQASATEMILSDFPPVSVPESITPVPSGFGPSGAAYIIPNGPNGNVYTIGASGGAPTTLAVVPGVPGVVGSAGGTFLPSNYGPLAGQFLDLGVNAAPSGPSGAIVGTATAISSSGFTTPLVTNFTQDGTDSQLNSAIVAPVGFGPVAGQVLISSSGGRSIGGIYALSTDGSTLTQFAAVGSGLYGIGFAPAGFGAFGGDLFATSVDGGNIYAINSSGDVSLFASNIFASSMLAPYAEDLKGLRQIAFAPTGYGSYGGDLFVSVASSSSGVDGGSGLILVFDDNGDDIALDNVGTPEDPLEPRGLYFADANTLLVANADPGIDILTPSSFSPVPEPSTLLIMFTGLGLFGLVRKSSDVQS
jgi:hypothetical protein